MPAGSDNNYDGGVSLESEQRLKKPKAGQAKQRDSFVIIGKQLPLL